MKKNSLWEEYTVYVMREDIGFEIPLCGLCGNLGIIDTTTTAKWDGKCVGIRKPCICPNGRKHKSRQL